MREDEIPLAMKQWEPTRKKRHPGDLFTFLMPDEKYRFIRYITDDALSGMGGPVNLLYVYDYASDRDVLPPRNSFVPPKLLIPPQLTNNLGWVRGYFRYVASWPLEQDEVLNEHCFQDQLWKDRYYDEYGTRLRNPVGIVGSWGLASFATIDLDVSRVLGIPNPFDIYLADRRSKKQ